MTAWLFGVALGAPVLGEIPTPEDELARCVLAADAEIDGPALPPPTRSDRVALVVGVPCHRRPGLPSLAYSSRDAARMGAELAGGGFSVVSRTTVVDLEDLHGAVDEAAALLEPGGTLLVYFSGHGILREEDGELARWLVLSDTDLGRIAETALPVSRLEGWLAATSAGSRVVVQDTCFASGGKGLGLPEHAKGIAPIEESVLRAGDLRLWASRFFEQALESPERRASLYTDHLLSALHQPSADLDGDGCVGLVEAHRWARSEVEAERGGFQVPTSSAYRVDDIVLGCVPGPATRALVGDAPDDLRLTLAARGEEPVASPASVRPGRWRVTVDAEDRRVHDEVLWLAAGERLDVEDRLRVAHRARLQLELAATGRISSELSEAGLGGHVDLVAPGGRWRPLLGVGGDEGLPVGEPALSTRGLRARAGVWFTPPSLWDVAIGPVLEGGIVWRTLTTPARTDAGGAGGLALHGQIGRGATLLFVEPGVELVPLERAVLELHAAPTLRVGLGVRL